AFQGLAVMNYVPVANLTRAYTVFEAGGLSPLHVAATFVSGRRDYADMAGRVHTRRDINWRPLLADGADAQSESAVPVFPLLVHDTQALCGDAIASTAALSDS